METNSQGSATPPTDAGHVPSFSPSREECTMALLCHLLGFFTSFIGPLIIWLIKKDQSAYINDQGKEALNFQITVAIAFVVASILSKFCIGVILFPIVGIANLVFCILASLAANKGQTYRYPVTLRLIK